MLPIALNIPLVLSAAVKFDPISTPVREVVPPCPVHNSRLGSLLRTLGLRVPIEAHLLETNLPETAFANANPMPMPAYETDMIAAMMESHDSL